MTGIYYPSRSSTASNTPTTITSSKRLSHFSSPSSSTDDLKLFLQSELDRFDSETVVDPLDTSLSMIKPSPNFVNISELNNGSTTYLASRQMNINISKEVINELPEEEEEEEETLIDGMIISEASKYKQIAQDIFTLKFKDVPIESYASFIGTNQPENLAVCTEFMKLLKPWKPSLLDSLRFLCSKIYLVGESTQIDQILEVFAKSWHRSFPKNQIGDYRSIHIVCFSLFILNSDLHNESNQENKFTKDEFVENTIMALNEESLIDLNDGFDVLERLLKSFYESIHDQQLEILRDMNQKIRRSSKRNVSSNSNSSKTRVDSVSNISVRSNRNSKRLSSIGSSVSLHRIASLTEPSDINYNVDYQKDDFDDKLEKLGPPWAIEGIMKSESASNVMKKKKTSWFARLTHSNTITSELDIYNIKDWKQSIVVISKGLLKQYSFGSTSDRKNFMKTRSDKFVNTVLTYNLYSATASLVGDIIVSNSQNKTTGVAWVLTIPNLLNNDYSQDQKIVYYAPNAKIANNFIETCNFWAARITSIPSTEDEIVTNAEYGWSNDVLTKNMGLDTIAVQKWECLLSIESSFIPSAFALSDQFDYLKTYMEKIEQTMEAHNKLKPVLQRVWGKKSLKNQYDLVMTNWCEKYAYLYKQREKYKIYMDSLAFALSFRASRV